MPKYKYLPHPADLKIQAFGANLEELFTNSALGMMNYIYEQIPKSTLKPHFKTIKIKSPDLKSLLVDWLSELLYLADTNKLIYTKFEFKKLTKTELIAEVAGQPAKAKEDIKAVTYHSLEIKPTKNGWQATVLFDI